MVDAADLKSVDLIDRAGSIPALGTFTTSLQFSNLLFYTYQVHLLTSGIDTVQGIAMSTILFSLSQWNAAYADSIVKFANNKNISNHLADGFPQPYTPADADRFITACIQNEAAKQFSRAILVDNEAVGSIGVFFKTDIYRKSADIAYWLAEPYWGKGIVTEAIRQMCDYTFNNSEIVRISAEPFLINRGSCKALEKAGFQLEGIKKKSVFKNGELIDSAMYAKLKV